MAEQIINIGTADNDGTGDTLREASRKSKENFSELYATKQDISTVVETTYYDAWSVGGLDVRGYATNYPILGTIYNAVPKTVTLATAPTTTDFKRIDIIAADTLGDIVIILGDEGLVGIEPFVDPNLYFRIRPLLLTAGATTPVDPDTGTGTVDSLVLFKEFGTVAGGESDVTGSDASIVLSSVTPITGTKSIEATTASNLDYAQFLFGSTQTTTGKTHFNFNLKLKSTVQTNKYWFFRVYNGTSIIGSFLFKHGQYGFNANDLGVQSISIPLTSTPFVDINYTKVTLFFYHNSGTIAGYWIDDVEFLNALPTIIYDNYTIGSSGTEKVSLYKNGALSTEVDLKTVLNTVALTPITTANKLVTEIDITGKEAVANKQNSLATDGTDEKYPTVDAVNAGLATKLDSSAYNQYFKGVYLTFAALVEANPTGEAGDYAQVNVVGAADVLNYNWDTEENIWIPNAVAGSGANNTDELPEGTVNLYHTGARVLATILSGLSIITGGDVVATDTVIQAFGKLQKNINTLWIAVNLNTAKVSFPEAPIDTKQYARKDGAWNEVVSGSTPPINEAFNSVLKFDADKYNETNYQQIGVIIYSLDALGHINGMVIRHKILSDGQNTISFPVGWNVFNKADNDIYPVGLQVFYFTYMGGDVDVSVPLYDGTITIPDTTAPIFSNVSVTPTGETTADFNSQINESGTIYWAVYPTADATHTKVEIQAGTSAVAFGNIVTAGSILETANITGLTVATPYKVHYFAKDSIPNETAVALTSEFTLTASIIVMQDNFDDNSIDTGKWTIYNPNPTLISITESSGKFNFIKNAISAPTTYLSDRAESVFTLSSGSIAGTFSRTVIEPSGAGFALILGIDINDRIVISNTPGNDTIRIYHIRAGVTLYSLTTGLPNISNSFKIFYDRATKTTKFYYWNTSWVEIGTYTDTVEMPVGLKALILRQNTDGAHTNTYSVDNFYMTNANYTNQIPS